eukprot:8147573-Ditylum_brightwellii.AAC.1
MVLTPLNIGKDKPGFKGEAYWSCCSVVVLVPTLEEEREEPIFPRNVFSSDSSSPLLTGEKMSKMC